MCVYVIYIYTHIPHIWSTCLLPLIRLIAPKLSMILVRFIEGIVRTSEIGAIWGPSAERIPGWTTQELQGGQGSTADPVG